MWCGSHSGRGAVVGKAVVRAAAREANTEEVCQSPGLRGCEGPGLQGSECPGRGAASGRDRRDHLHCCYSKPELARPAHFDLSADVANGRQADTALCWPAAALYSVVKTVFVQYLLPSGEVSTSQLPTAPPRPRALPLPAS